LLHDVIVEKARTIYQDLVNEEEDEEELDEKVCDEEAEEDAIEENFAFAEDEDEFAPEEDSMGGDETEDFMGDIEASPEGEFGEEGEELEVEDRVEDLETALADLRAEFDMLMGGEEADLGDDEFNDEESFAGDEGLGDEFAEPEMEESMYEGIQDTVAAPSNTENAGDKKSMYTQAPSKKLDGADPIKGSGGEEAGYKAAQGKEQTPTDNVDVDQKPVAKPADKEGKVDANALFTKAVK